MDRQCLWRDAHLSIRCKVSSRCAAAYLFVFSNFTSTRSYPISLSTRGLFGFTYFKKTLACSAFWLPCFWLFHLLTHHFTSRTQYQSVGSEFFSFCLWGCTSFTTKEVVLGCFVEFISLGDADSSQPLSNDLLSLNAAGTFGFGLWVSFFKK